MQGSRAYVLHDVGVSEVGWSDAYNCRLNDVERVVGRWRESIAPTSARGLSLVLTSLCVP